MIMFDKKKNSALLGPHLYSAIVDFDQNGHFTGIFSTSAAVWVRWM